MRQGIHRILLSAGIGLGAPAATAHAQVRGIPVYNSGITTGIALYGDAGFSNDDAGKGTAFAISGRAGTGPFGATAIISTFNPDGPPGSELSVGATLNYNLFGGPLIPLSVTLQGGIGYSKPEAGFLPSDEVNEFRFPVGLGFALTIPNPALAIKPWIAPRVDIVRQSAGGSSNTETDFGIGAGLELNLLSGLGLHAAYDRVFVEGGDPGVFGFGAHYTFRVAGL